MKDLVQLDNNNNATISTTTSMTAVGHHNGLNGLSNGSGSAAGTNGYSKKTVVNHKSNCDCDKGECELGQVGKWILDETKRRITARNRRHKGRTLIDDW